MRILFVDDEPELVALHCRLLAEALDAEVHQASSVEEAVEALHEAAGADVAPFDLVVTDIFIPLGDQPRQVMGPRARRYAETVRHLGGLVLLDELDRVDPPPAIIAYTACTDFELLQILGERVTDRIPKPAPADVMLRAALGALGFPVPG